MSEKAKAIKTLYNSKRITLEGVKKAAADALITKEEYELITGLSYEVTKEE